MNHIRQFAIVTIMCMVTVMTWGQTIDGSLDNSTYDRRTQANKKDSLGSDKVIPTGIKVWTVDSKFGDRRAAEVDTAVHMFQNSIFTTGTRGEYNTTGNLGAPRINRIFIDRTSDGQFIFTQPYDFVVTPVEAFHFTNTLSPITNLTYNTAGNRTNGEDHLTAKFGVNAGKRFGVGFKFDYLYGRGYYSSQSTSHFNYSMYGSYLGDQYQAHLLLALYHQKVTENGGIENDNYITHPETVDDNYSSSEIPTVLERNWNRNNSLHLFFTHRYSLGFHKKVKMTDEEIKAKKFAMESQKEQRENEKERDSRQGKNATNKRPVPDAKGRPRDARIVSGEMPTDTTDTSTNRILVSSKTMADSLLAGQPSLENKDTSWMKTEYVPVTSFIHTLNFDKYERIYQAYETPENFYAHTYNNVGPYTGDSIYDKTRHYRLQNVLALSLLEGFNKWAKSGLKAFITSDLRHFELPDSAYGKSSYNEHNLSVGGQLYKFQGNTFHYCVTAETWFLGKDAGQLKIDATADLNFKLFGDTVTLKANGFFYRLNPSFYFRHYHSKHFWWDNDDLDKIIHSRVEGVFSCRKTKTTLRVAYDNISNYTYFGMSYNIADDYKRSANNVNVRQSNSNISLLTLSLAQDFKLGPLRWENVVTYQKSSSQDVLAVPEINVYTNLYLKFRIAHVLNCDFGADARFFTKYYAHDYSAALGQYAIQEGAQRVEVGSYPIVNVYANFHLKRTRFFIMMSHVNANSGNKEYFLTPHYPINQRILRFGLSWNFFN